MQQTREPGHRRDARREGEHAERAAERGRAGDDRPPPRRQLATDGERDQRQPAEVPGEVCSPGVHHVGGEQPPRLAGEHRVAGVGERGERARARRRDDEAGEPEGGEGEEAAHGVAPSSHRARVASWLLFALPGLIASWGCVSEESLPLRFESARFNERIAADLQPLSPRELDTDLRYGTFRDGSEDPDGDGPRQGGLVSEIFPVGAAGAHGPGNLVQTPCLFVGRRSGRGDQLRLSWEVVGDLDRSTDELLEEVFLEPFDELGMCTLSSPVSRVIFEDPSAPYPDPQRFGADGCSGVPGNGNRALTFLTDPDEAPRNVPLSCRVLGRLATLLTQRVHDADNPDALCPVGPFSGSTGIAPVYDCMSDGQQVPACALPCGVEPVADASYHVRIDPGNRLGLPDAERWLSPDVLVVEDRRALVRPMAGDACEQPAEGPWRYAWQTKVTSAGGSEGPVQWAENFSPTVRVDTARILSRDPSGGSQVVERPQQDRLVVEIPRAGETTPTVLECTGTLADDGLVFPLGDCAAASDEPGVLDALTPTYLVANLSIDPVVKQPIAWRATLDGCDPGRQVFIELGLRAQTEGAALRVSSALDFGRVPDTEYRQGSVELENVGGETVEVSALGLLPAVGHPGDFTVFTLGDPVPVPLPIDAKQATDGSVSWTLGDLGEVPVLGVVDDGRSIEVRLGDPAAGPGVAQPLTVYGEATTLRGAFLTRDDRAAEFVSPSGTERPLVIPAYAEESVPFALRPGERRTVVVEARPTAHGLRRAELVVRYASSANPLQGGQVRSQLRVEVVSGPLLQHAPPSLWVERDANGGQPGHRTAMVSNAGHFDLTVHGLQLTGPGAARFVATTDLGPGPFLLRPGDYVDVRVEYLPECDGTYGTATSALDHEATLVVTSDGGTARIGLGGASQGFCGAP
jgi:hypothetical protein